jgi:hypothetical protein
MSERESWSAFVHFGDGPTKVVTLVDQPPRQGQALVGNLSQGWIVAEVHVREGELEGQSYQFEVRAKRGQ